MEFCHPLRNTGCRSRFLMKKHNILLVFCCALLSVSSAQTNAPAISLFEAVDMETVQLRGNFTRDYIPEKYETYRLDFAALQSALQRAPREFTAAARQRGCVLAFPVAGGGTEA